MADLWTLPNGSTIRTVIERVQQDITLPIRQDIDVTITLISGSLPGGLRIDGTQLKGTPFEVETTTSSLFALRATTADGAFQDRTFEIITVGADDPRWVTPEGLLRINQQAYFILDNEPVDFQLQAIDPDLPAGDDLEFYISSGDGELPPGTQLTRDGRIVGVVEPILALDKRADDGSFDSNAYDGYPLDFNIVSDSGYASFYYDSQFYDYAVPTRTPRKLNRYYEFTVSVSDGDTVVKRKFRIFVVGDDFLRSDNTQMKIGNGIFSADNTHVRTPIWLTPANLGYKRANNYLTLKLDALDTDTLSGYLVYSLVDNNPDGSISMLPPGTSIDTVTGEIYGRVPYQPAITKEYNFTVRATRFTGETNVVVVTGQVYEDTQKDLSTFKIFKLDQSLADGIDDLNALLGRTIVLDGFSYKITAINGTIADYDEITVTPPLKSANPFVVIEQGVTGNNYVWSNGLSTSQRELYLNRTIKIGENEKYKITSIIPYVEWDILDKTHPTIDVDTTTYVKQGQVSDITITAQGLNYSSATVTITGGGGGGAAATPVIDGFGRIVGITVIDGGTGYTSTPTVTITGTFNGTAYPAAATANLAYETRNEQITRLMDNSLGPIYIEDIDPNRITIRAPSVPANRNADKVKSFFDRAGSDIRLSISKNNFERTAFDINLQRNLIGDISLGTFRGSVFEERIITAEDQDEVTNPYSEKTFNVKILGEVESTINWISPSDLGEIQANFLSTLAIKATTTVPDSKLIYTLIDGQLPNGLTLAYDGQIIGKARQFSSGTAKGLTIFDNNTTTFDGGRTSATSFDRQYKFTVRAQDRFGFSAIEREFTLKIQDPEDVIYSNLYMKPFLSAAQRRDYVNFVSDPNVFPPEYIYRPNDPAFGLQKEIKMLAYAGIETKQISSYVAAAAKNHKRKRYSLGKIKKAVAKEPHTNNIVYEVVYIEVIDPLEPTKGKTRLSYNTGLGNKITVDSLQYAAKDDVTKQGAGYPEIIIQGRERSISIPLKNEEEFDIITRSGDIEKEIENLNVEVESRSGSVLGVSVGLSDSEPMRLRPKTNTIKADSNAVVTSDSNDGKKYISNISNMRSRLEEVGRSEGGFMPLWMRSTQAVGQQELGYITAVPLCYCLPNTADSIILNIENTTFDFSLIDFEIDRYIIDTTQGNSDEQYILFANYQFNV